jgi:hypothetical protein
MSETPYCAEHSHVMQCLGKLEANSERNYQSLIALHGKMDSLKGCMANGKAKSAVEQAKSGMLYWALGIVGGAVVLSVVTSLVTRWIK